MAFPVLPSADFAISATVLGILGIALVIASFTDLKTREVPDMLNYGLVFVGLSLNGFLSIAFSDYHFILNSLLGLVICFAIGWLMFYAGQWGGGDSKMLMGLGSVLGLPLAWGSSFLLALLLNILFAGAIYGLLWSIFLAVKNRKKFRSAFIKITKGKIHSIARILIVLALISVPALYFVRFENSQMLMALLWLILLGPLMYYVWLLVKAVEKSSMLVLQPISKLTEGDWIAKDVFIKGKRITGPKDLGISKAQISLLKKYEKRHLIKKILVKQGIPFIPSFLLALIFTLLWGNPFILLVGLL